MDELIKSVTEKTGLSPEQAQKAAEAVLDFLKEKAPAPIAGQIDNLVSGGDMASSAGDALKGLGGMFGKK
jgi:hypothetical protein